MADDAGVRDANHLELSATITELEPLRFTPAGVPAVALTLEHASTGIVEAGQARTVNAMVPAVALGAVAETLAVQAVGSQWLFNGFMATARKGSKRLVFHIQHIATNPS